MSYSPHDTETIRRLTRELSEAKKKITLLTEQVEELKTQNADISLERNKLIEGLNLIKSCVGSVTEKFW